MLRPQAPWRLYLLAVASFGLYLPYWMHRAARDLGRGPFASLLVALGSLVPPVCAPLLFDVGRRGGAGRTAALATLLYAGLLAALVATPARELWTPALLGLPIPFAWVQHAANRARRAPAPGFRPAQWVLLALGLPAVLAVAWVFDGPRLRLDFAPTLDPGSVVVEPGGRFQLTVPSSFWRRAEPVAAGDRTADLAFVSDDGSARLLVYAHASPPTTLDEVVAARRQALFARGSPRRLHEERAFLPGGDFALGSRADYLVATPGGAPLAVRVDTFELGHAVVEAVASTRDPDGWHAELSGFADSLRAVAPSAARPEARR